MTPTTALKQISKVKKHIAALELNLVLPGIDLPEENHLISEDLASLQELLKQYEAVLSDWKVI